MPDLMIPVTEAESLVNNQDRDFPPGAWQGTIEEARIRALDYLQQRTPDQLTNQGYTSADVEVVSLQIGDNEGLEEDAADVGNQKFFTPDIVIRDGDYAITDDNVPESAWQLQRSQRAIGGICVALGQAEQVEDQYVIPEGFVSALLNGDFEGQQLGFETFHRPWTSKDGQKSGVNVEVRRYFPAV